ncbi:UDP-N-acetylhexosamine pyrophosphorylase [Halotydeus destructor]|nr:UDP-N-acetylhexosamine pyrophosphorylase [Halotydeus destructor]
MDLDSLKAELQAVGQEHLLQFWDILTDDQKEVLYADLKTIEFGEVTRVFKESTQPNSEHDFDDSQLEPLPDEVYEGVSSAKDEDLAGYREEGLRQISEGRVAVLLLAGGQGTRLGVNYPKGMYDVGLPSHKTLYQLQGERIRRLEQLALDLTGKSAHIPWYIMTSEHTKEPTVEFFESHGYFGLKPENVILFEQNTLPCFTFDGKIILERTNRVARAPDGNGGLYAALRAGKILDDMEARGIQYIHVYCVDNILVKMADPTFVGYCVKKGAQAGAKVVEKSVPTEAVGVICKVKGKYQVVEYSEISKETSEARNADSRLTFNAGSICNHFFTLSFLQLVCNGKQMKHHIAKKKIPFVDSDGVLIKPDSVNGIKLEKFVFDVFHFTDKFVVWEVLRDEEFSPLKNANSAGKDCPDTTRQDLFNLHQKYILKAGGRFGETENGEAVTNGKTHKDPVDPCAVCEISPLLSYDGEGLRGLVEAKQLSSPVVLFSEEEALRSPVKTVTAVNGTAYAELKVVNGAH